MNWAEIKGYKDYQISEKGDVRRKDKQGIHIVQNTKASNGKKYITLWKYGERKTFMLHNLYAEAFKIPVKRAERIIYDGFDDDPEAKENVKSWLSEKIEECERSKKNGAHLKDEILWLKSFLKQVEDPER